MSLFKVTNWYNQGFRTPKFVKHIMPSAWWGHNTNEKNIFLTFDDGPCQDVTPFVLDSLAIINAKATFFCVGEQVLKHPAIFQRILNEGHSVGNHTFSHLNGFKTPNNVYFEDIKRASTVIESDLFRPPYGRLTPSQYWHLKQTYKIVFWHLLAADYKQSIDPQICINRSTTNAKYGDILVLHDSKKAFKNLKIALPLILEFYHKHGFSFQNIKT